MRVCVRLRDGHYASIRGASVTVEGVPRNGNGTMRFSKVTFAPQSVVEGKLLVSAVVLLTQNIQRLFQVHFAFAWIDASPICVSGAAVSFASVCMH